MSSNSRVRSGFVYGQSDANWFGVVCTDSPAIRQLTTLQVLNSPTHWSSPGMHFPDEPQTEECDRLVGL
jgi:hypothetical protein